MLRTNSDKEPHEVLLGRVFSWCYGVSGSFRGFRGSLQGLLAVKGSFEGSFTVSFEGSSKGF